ncbi:MULTISPECIES: glutathione S-transferase [unclassified Tolypothrix]|uniref:glutathione S-transferase n=1 Tax=unclassified Tolypothrix TaxID=2649714 RepID=UPI0005EAA94D|nr:MULTISPECIES: glutathione S-transferase family protein [unclassified Tolypothrix]BAY89887.1 glutathione S-transferase [Microchaete diplosiphon NIES-3275]EKE96944.1 glutathione S-transferase protein [Tolypothrix sp. PCC 7601]MBE9082170.1 glutathione S-transferase family protein [Tolypothrix sp. LEGE 11397]UYD24126.1 glutathione S-transferase family protein [Tolypothrix sp. PCC 7712]UYD33642.1 glutathione S-transferase family protein [Tolypothrix sp. PCC 7601]
MLELYQWELSQYSEKVRLILDYKELNYRKIEVTPGIGQVELFRLTGQRQVPVLKDGSRYIADSTEIAKYLDLEYPERPLIPKDPKKRGACLLIEEWADESIGIKGRKALFAAISQDQNFRKSLLPTSTPDILKNLIEGVPRDFLTVLGVGVGYSPDVIKSAIADLKQDLEALTLLLADSPYLLGDEPSLADLAVAGLSILLKFPEGPYLDLPAELKGKGLPGLGDNPDYAPFFEWRDRIYAQFRKPLTGTTSSASRPTSIQID